MTAQYLKRSGPIRELRSILSVDLLGELVLLQLDVINPEARRVESSEHLQQVGQPRVLS